ncbi:hypothetical protein [Phenylobacterium sp.]|jgi:hypothetical protein|uniref:hypothetical protein n=1 Tax=Phenylobacterium sp. TaxID=1871053 RepID=UPI0037840E5C
MTKVVQLAMLAAAGLIMTGAAAAQPQAASPPAMRVVRFDAKLDAQIPPRGPDGHFRPAGSIIPDAGSDPVVGENRPYPYGMVVQSNILADGTFSYDSTAKLAGGEIHMKSVYPVRNAPSPIPGLSHTVMTDKIVGGTGAFEGASGYLQLQTLLSGRQGEPSKLEGSFTGVIFLKTVPAR